MKKTERQLRRIHSATIECSQRTNDYQKIYSASLSHASPELKELTAIYDQRSDDETAAYMNHIGVPEKLQKQGIATRLVGALALYLVHEGIYYLETHASSSYTIRIFQKLLKPEALVIRDPNQENIHPRFYSPEEAVHFLDSNEGMSKLALEADLAPATLWNDISNFNLKSKYL